jgi:hypothetical protein
VSFVQTYFSPFPTALIIEESATEVVEQDLTMFLVAVVYRDSQVLSGTKGHSVASVVASSQALSNPSAEVQTIQLSSLYITWFQPSVEHIKNMIFVMHFSYFLALLFSFSP